MEKSILLLIITLIFSCNSQVVLEEKNKVETEKINGLSLVSENSDLMQSHIGPMLNVNCNYAAVIPFGFISALDNPNLSFDSKWQWKGEKIIGTESSIDILHENGIKVMVKPQLWVGRGDFTGKIEMNSEKDWDEFEKGYEAYILSFAKIAEKHNAELFCMGTELNRFVMARSDFWLHLITEIRSVYSGKITYAENWDCYSRVPFWNELDYVGVDAYFPISDNVKPSKKELLEGWELVQNDLQKVSEKNGKQILFTEFGYRSITSCAKAPWDYNNGGEADQEAQEKTLSALFETVWAKEYMAGGFLWKWYPAHGEAGGKSDTKFTVQNKKAENLLRDVYQN